MGTFAENLPFIFFEILLMVLLIAGAVLTARARRQHGRAAMLGMYGCIVLLVGEVYTLVRGLALPMYIDAFGYNVVTALLMGLIGFVLTGAGLGLLIGAVITRRPQTAAQPQNAGWQQEQPYQPPQQQPEWQQQSQPPPGWQPQSPPQPPPSQQPGWQNPEPPNWQNPQG
jgi:hypothetical protein